MRIAIVTPSFNQAEFLERTLRSVLDQDGPFDLDYRVVDGGSTDGSVDILRRAESWPPRRGGATRFRWLSEPDAGQSDAINKGLALVQGEIAAYLNSDDTYRPGALARVAAFFEARPAEDFLTGRCRVIDREDREIHRWITRYKNLLLRFPSFPLLLVENFISQPATFFRKALLDEIGMLDPAQHLVMDYDLWCRIAARRRICVLPEYLADFRWYPDSKSGDNFARQFSEEYAVACRHLRAWSPLRGLHYLNARKIVGAYRLMRLLRPAPR